MVRLLLSLSLSLLNTHAHIELCNFLRVPNDDPVICTTLHNLYVFFLFCFTLELLVRTFLRSSSFPRRVLLHQGIKKLMMPTAAEMFSTGDVGPSSGRNFLSKDELGMRHCGTPANRLASRDPSPRGPPGNKCSMSAAKNVAYSFTVGTPGSPVNTLRAKLGSPTSM